MEIKIDTLAKKITKNSPDLITRPVGRQMYSKLADKMNLTGQGEVVVLDFDNIKVIDSSFIDEFIVKLVRESMEHGRFFVKLKNISDISEINIGSVIQSYRQVDKKIVVMTEDICLNNNFYIGELTQEEHDTVNFIRINRQVSYEDLAAGTGMNETKAGEILDNLITLRLVRRLDKNLYCSV